MRGGGLGPLSLGTSNIDHLVLTGDTWLIIDAKGCRAGTLGLNPKGKGVLVKTDGILVPQKWLDDGRAYSRSGVIYRLTDAMQGLTAWIVPDSTLLHPSVQQTTCRKRGGDVLSMRAIVDGYFDQHFFATTGPRRCGPHRQAVSPPEPAPSVRLMVRAR
ncbi:hypothetical protein E1292_43030 [Nonomuraea deserti]|uniref:NERD domain-containing protein n=1 Tax=Nonomuraea deserti TaxID=1848322 RepID=A0A4R4UGT2_9ACTN|nr:hypothetical protein [Nonomuraea deserti]TDC91038.1 hypothetical protein E1292_43030 [Nonomuraea deserti]